MFEDDFETPRHTDVMLRLQRISTLLIGEGQNGALNEHVLDAAIDLMSADMGSMQVFHPERRELRLLAERGFNSESAAHWEWVRPQRKISIESRNNVYSEPEKHIDPLDWATLHG